jgi:hypothetical protein
MLRKVNKKDFLGIVPKDRFVRECFTRKGFVIENKGNRIATGQRIGLIGNKKER